MQVGSDSPALRPNCYNYMEWRRPEVDSGVEYVVDAPSRKLGREPVRGTKGTRSTFASHGIVGGNRHFVSVSLLGKNVFLIWKQ
jgi:hypothetical protein